MIVSYIQCDRCHRREQTDLTPPGWTFPDDEDLCPACSKKAPPRVSPRHSEGEK